MFSVVISSEPGSRNMRSVRQNSIRRAFWACANRVACVQCSILAPAVWGLCSFVSVSRIVLSRRQNNTKEGNTYLKSAPK